MGSTNGPAQLQSANVVAARHLPNRDDCKKNLWFCVCSPTYNTAAWGRGRKRHAANCPRGRWETDPTLPFAPPHGKILTVLACAAPRKGRFQFNSRKKWIEIDSSDKPTDGKPLDDLRRPSLKKKTTTSTPRPADCSKKVNSDGLEMCRCSDFAVAQRFTRPSGQVFYGCARWQYNGCGYKHFLFSGET